MFCIIDCIIGKNTDRIFFIYEYGIFFIEFDNPINAPKLENSISNKLVFSLILLIRLDELNDNLFDLFDMLLIDKTLFIDEIPVIGCSYI